jgi:hypothetical protein
MPYFLGGLVAQSKKEIIPFATLAPVVFACSFFFQSPIGWPQAEQYFTLSVKLSAFSGFEPG